VASVGVLDPAGGAVEIGWVIGWQLAGGSCTNHYFAHPELFITWQSIGGTYNCQNIEDLTSEVGDYPDLWVSDYDGNTVYDFDYQGSEVAHYNVNFSDDTAYTNGERHSASADRGDEDFKGLRYQLGTSTWNNFSSSTFLFQDDPDYGWVYDSATRSEVVDDGA
jgi:hypothetical protein